MVKIRNTYHFDRVLLHDFSKHNTFLITLYAAMQLRTAVIGSTYYYPSKKVNIK